MKKRDEKSDSRTYSYISLGKYFLFAILILAVIFAGYLISLLSPMTLSDTALNTVKLYKMTSNNKIEYIGTYGINDYMPSGIIIDYVYRPIPNTLDEALSVFDIVVYGRIIEIDVIKSAGFHRWSYVLYKIYIKKVYKGLGPEVKYIYVAYIGGFDEKKGILKYDEDVGYFKVGQELIFFVSDSDQSIPTSITSKFRVTYLGTEYVLKVVDNVLYPIRDSGFMKDLEGKSLEEFEALVGE